MIIKEVRQNCPKCHGTGVDSKKPKMIDDRQATVQFDKKTEVPVFENCKECNGQGQVLLPVPENRIVEGEKVPNPISETTKRPVLHV